MIAAELRRLTASRMSIIALLALLLVPVLYGGLYLWANQDPYARFDEIPVALVDSDTGVAASADEPSHDYGADVAAKLLDGRAFDWRAMSAAAAERALAQGDVDFVVVIPADFSESLASVSGDAPHRAAIRLETNDANNYLASTIGSQAVEKIRASVAELVSREAAERLLDGIADIRVQLVDAADGAARVAEGAGDAADGAQQLDAGATRLADGTATLAAGAREVADGAHQVAAGTQTIAGYADRAGSAVQAAASALPEARDDIAAALAEQGLDASQIDAVLARLDPVADRLRQGNQTVQTAVGRVDALADGAAQVAGGADRVAGGADSAADGAVKLSAGVSTLADGLSALADGTDRLRDGLASGVDAIPDSTAELRARQAETISDPVAVESGKLASADDYGAGLAPFFAALAGWIGIYALFLIVKPISRRAVTALHSPVRITLAGWLTPALLGGLQMAMLFGILSFALGFGFANPLGTLAVMVLASFTYAAIILALNVWFGSVGQFLGLVLMVVQLVTAGGTFPWQTLPSPLAGLHHVLPMGFVVDAMRQLMYGGDIARVGFDLSALLMWMLGALLLATIGVTRMTHFRTLRDLQPSLIG